MLNEAISVSGDLSDCKWWARQLRMCEWVCCKVKIVKQTNISDIYLVEYYDALIADIKCCVSSICVKDSTESYKLSRKSRSALEYFVNNSDYSVDSA